MKPARPGVAGKEVIICNSGCTKPLHQLPNKLFPKGYIEVLLAASHQSRYHLTSDRFLIDVDQIEVVLHIASIVPSSRCTLRGETHHMHDNARRNMICEYPI